MLKPGIGGVDVDFHKLVFDFKILILQLSMKIIDKSFSSLTGDIVNFSNFITKKKTLKSL